MNEPMCPPMYHHHRYIETTWNLILEGNLSTCPSYYKGGFNGKLYCYVKHQTFASFDLRYFAWVKRQPIFV